MVDKVKATILKKMDFLRNSSFKEAKSNSEINVVIKKELL
ncbi:hypothetical protein EYM_06025 [Ignicoccus islandicus DSM 13165]|uniref:Uncharacterized protein n=1 Tax=Ignicoccus islandicus DSM 13165 TaxID=940295 RepID=A0A0U3F4Z9_9CREN|nr:hypothetical protein EYM_06025 [Ignicoccus islandicus DSM 13165]